METGFEGRVVLVTGAASGIGRATAEAFGARGARVACTDIREDQLADTVSAVEKSGGEAMAMALDVSDSKAATAAVERCAEQWGGLNILANVAGVLKLDHAHQLSDEDWNRVLGINLGGTFFMSRAAIPHLLEEAGCIVNVASLAGLKGQAYGAAYCASKAGVVALTRVMAVEYAARGLRVNCVCPGAVDTPLISGFTPPDDFDPELVNRLSLVPKMTTANEVAESIVYLASPAARSINGVALPIDFGTHAS